MLAANNQILTQHTVQVIKEKHFILNEFISEADMALLEHIGTPLFVILCHQDHQTVVDQALKD